MPTLTKAITADELLDMGDIGRCELIKGEVIPMTPGGAEHGDRAFEISWIIANFVKKKKLGKVYAAETGFLIARQPDTVRAPDIGFVGNKRLPKSPVRGYFPGPPDLAIEVVSPGDRAGEIAEKTEEWLAAGTVSVWVVNTSSNTVAIYRRPKRVLRYRLRDEIRDEPTLPGFVLKLRDIFSAE